MTLFYGALAVLAGLTLLVFSLDTLTDPFWSRTTRASAIAGALVGTACTVLGITTIATI